MHLLSSSNICNHQFHKNPALVKIVQLTTQKCKGLLLIRGAFIEGRLYQRLSLLAGRSKQVPKCKQSCKPNREAVSTSKQFIICFRVEYLSPMDRTQVSSLSSLTTIVSNILRTTPPRPLPPLRLVKIHNKWLIPVKLFNYFRLPSPPFLLLAVRC